MTNSSMPIELPPFDTGEYEGCELSMANGDAELTLHVFGMPPICIKFTRVRWHRYTALYACDSEWISGFYFKVAEVPNSTELAAHLKADKSSTKAYAQLHHFRIFIDETGCHDFLAETARML